MGLLDNLANEQQQYPCRIRTLLGEFEPSDKEILIRALKDLAWTANGLSKALAKKGVSVSGHVITRHRKGECSC